MTVMSVAVALVWIAGFWVLSRDTVDTAAVTLTGALASLVSVGLVCAQIWPQIQAGYPRDSYWSLNWVGYAGVVAISLVGISLFFLATAWKSRIVLRLAPMTNRVLVFLIDVALGQLTFAVLLSLSPQVFYSLYLFLFPDLPQQWVVKGILDVDRLKVVAQMNAGGNLSDHLAGLTLWAVIPFTLWLHLRFWRSRRVTRDPV